MLTWVTIFSYVVGKYAILIVNNFDSITALVLGMNIYELMYLLCLQFRTRIF